MAVHLDALKVSLELRGLNGVVQVRGDRTQLQQVVINLLMNGAGSMMARGSDRRLVLECAAEANDLMSVTVDDLGNGIAPGIAHRLHEPLFTTKENGMGMGLAISHSIVDAHGGKLTLSARECVGTRAAFTLPRLAH
ncbi:ATP-binding protein [Paraburkholderia azotifigens]|uniref:ATP-binding protein n=1 Tax=Paraburkholderia azotifigens TaxID=2057004 RepID=UPI00317BA3DF